LGFSRESREPRDLDLAVLRRSPPGRRRWPSATPPSCPASIGLGHTWAGPPRGLTRTRVRCRSAITSGAVGSPHGARPTSASAAEAAQAAGQGPTCLPLCEPPERWRRPSESPPPGALTKEGPHGDRDGRAAGSTAADQVR